MIFVRYIHICCRAFNVETQFRQVDRYYLLLAKIVFLVVTTNKIFFKKLSWKIKHGMGSKYFFNA